MVGIHHSLTVFAVLAGLGLLLTNAFAEDLRASGSMDATYAKRDLQSIREGHVLMLSDASGINRDTKRTGFLDGFAFNIREIADLDRGTGPSQGYVIFSKGSDHLVGKLSARITTSMKDGHPDTTFKGEWRLIEGKGTLADTRGSGTYAGFFTGPDKFHVDWEGWHSQPQASAGAQ